MLDLVWDGLVCRGKVPADFRAVALDEVDPLDVVRLYVAHIGGVPDAVRRRIDSHVPDGFVPELSPVLKVGDRVAAVVQGRAAEPGVGFVDAVIVDEAFRRA